MPRARKSKSEPRATPSKTVAASEAREAPRRETPTSADAPRAPLEEGLELWTRFARETGETVTEFLRRFGEEQQKNYESWSTSLADVTRPAMRDRGTQEVQTRLEEWNRRAEEIGTRVRDAFQTALEPQKELLDAWVKPFLPKEATPQDKAREATELVQKLYTGLTTNLSRRLFETLQPGRGVEDLVRAQEESLKEFSDSFQKLTQLYFTSPAFVSMFGKTLDASLDLQKAVKEGDDVFSKITGFPSRREITELNQAVKDLSAKVSRLNTGRA
ncbi:MAG: hypothetical protein KGJ23_13240 [Euryarchaeota archaeon]|nr:hypothetical protein [Euryarchaeota archaeon]MDE1837563.1 hypothetical protein [Euryarchaeota archaeon]MDE1880044.1 hypothetical protein [Euryarchaeota archaeon]MDE2046127.1 hypothetical protein [Thermoplasmata archaeon]